MHLGHNNLQRHGTSRNSPQIPPRTDKVIPNPKAKSLEQVLRVKYYAIGAKESYVAWIKRFIFFHGKRHPARDGASQVQGLFSDLAVKQNGSLAFAAGHG